MEEDKLNNAIYMIDKETGQEIKIGSTGLYVPKLAKGGVLYKEPMTKVDIGENEQLGCLIKIKTITKKRFKKLLMSFGIPRNNVNIFYEAYMELGQPRSLLGMIIFLSRIKKGLDMKYQKLEEE